MKGEFVKFLKGKRLYSAFIRNCKNPECNSNTHEWRGIGHYLDDNDVYSYISAAFIWDRTPNGLHLWNDISIEWFDLCDE